MNEMVASFWDTMYIRTHAYCTYGYNNWKHSSSHVAVSRGKQIASVR